MDFKRVISLNEFSKQALKIGMDKQPRIEKLTFNEFLKRKEQLIAVGFDKVEVFIGEPDAFWTSFQVTADKISKYPYRFIPFTNPDLLEIRYSDALNDGLLCFEAFSIEYDSLMNEYVIENQEGMKLRLEFLEEWPAD